VRTEFSGLFGGGYDWQKEHWIFGPQLTLQYKRVDIDGFTETTSSMTPLTILDQSQESFQSRAGAHVGYRAKMGKVFVTPDLNVSWQHEYLDNSMAIDSRFAKGAGNAFTVHGPQIGADSMVVGAGVWVQWTERIGTYLNYTTQIGSENYNLQSVNAGVNFSF
jgi:outer membrane autotransporter protein